MRLALTFSLLAFGLAACSSDKYSTPVATGQVPAVYQARTDTGPNGEQLTIPAIRAAYLNERNQRQRVAYNGPEAAGTIVVDPYARVLYHVLENNEAMRFGIAVGRAGRGYHGSATIRRKAAWPSWRPTDNMIRTEPELYAQFAGGVKGGMENPLGPRALYLYEGDRDTYYRIHGTMDPSSVGKATSAGCIRLFNQDVMDLFEETPMGTRVVVRSQADSLRMEGPLIETPEGYVLPASEAEALGFAGPASVVTDALPAGQTMAEADFVSPVESAVRSR